MRSTHKRQSETVMCSLSEEKGVPYFDLSVSKRNAMVALEWVYVIFFNPRKALITHLIFHLPENRIPDSYTENRRDLCFLLD